jgi:hypothetical protein
MFIHIDNNLHRGAEKPDSQIVKTYAEDCKSGLLIKSRGTL